MNKEVANASESVKYLIGFQLLSRVLTFVLNLLIIRKVSPEIFGIGNAQLQLFINIVLLLSREAFRKVAARCSFAKHTSVDSNDMKVEIKEMVRFVWCVVPFGLAIDVIFTTMFIYLQSEEELQTPNYAAFIYVCSFAVLLEILSEPFWIFMQMMFHIKQRVEIEAYSVFIRCITVFFLIYFTNAGVLAFALAECAFAVCSVGGFLWYFKKDIEKKDPQNPFTSFGALFPDIQSLSTLVNGKIFWLTVTFFWQSIQKLLLQEGEKFVLKFTESLVNQGTFSVISNLGSLVVRFLFLPVEEISFTLFSKLLSTSDSTKSSANSNHRLCLQILVVVLKLMVLIGSVFICFGPNFCALLLELLYGEKYGRNSAAPTILAIYCYYVCFLAMNGITEALFTAAASNKQLQAHNLYLILFSGFYIATSVVLIHYYATVGLILANCLNMLVRIIFSVSFINKYFAAHLKDGKTTFNFLDALPNKLLLVALVISFIVTGISQKYLHLPHPTFSIYGIAHVCVGVICLSACAAIFFKTEKQFISDFRALKSQKAKTS